MYRIVILSVFLILLSSTAYSADTVIVYDTVYIFDSTTIIATNVAELKAEFYDRAIQGLESEKSSVNTLFTIISIIFVIVTLATGYATYSAKKSREEVDREIDRIRGQRDTIDKEVTSTRLLRVSVQNDADKLIDKTDEIRKRLDKESEEIHGELKTFRSEIDETKSKLDKVIEEKTGKFDELLQRAKQSSKEIDKITEGAKKDQIVSPEKIAELIESPDAEKLIYEYEQIVEKYKEIDALQSLPSKLHKTAGMSYLHQKKYKEALFAFQRYLYIIPGDTEAHFRCGHCLVKLSQFEEAIMYYRMVVTSDPDNVFGYKLASLSNWGNALLDLYDDRKDVTFLRQAKKLFEQVISINVKFARAHSYLGRTLFKIYEAQKDESFIERSFKEFEQAIAIDDRDYRIYETWGFAIAALFRIRKDKTLLEGAIEKYQKSLELNPVSSNAHYNIACILSLKGQKEKMLSALKRAISLDSKYKKMALEDEDFEAYKKDPDFLAIVNPSKDDKKSKGKSKN